MDSRMEQVKQRYAGCQTFLTEGCLFLSLCSIAEERTGEKIDILGAIYECKKRGLVRDDGYINDSCAILALFTGDHWTRKTTVVLGKVADNEYTIEKWIKPGSTLPHFRRRYVDTLRDSLTVRHGVREAYYVYVAE